jgi:hypothetical protein
MSNADAWFFVTAFAIVLVVLSFIRGRLKRIEEKIDKMSSK